MGWKTFTGEYLTFTRKERIGLIVMVILIVGIWIFPKLVDSAKSKSAIIDTSWINAAKKLQHTPENSKNNSRSNDENIDELVYAKTANEHFPDQKSELFYFDPNSLSIQGWKKLGIREKTIITIQKYLKKGGHFYKPEDLKKIYGLHPDEYASLEPYVRIEMINNNPDQNNTKTEFKKDQPSNYNTKYHVIEINVADTSAFIELPGIGGKLAVRIVNFRDKLGGFYSIDQIGATYGLPDSTFKRIKPFLKLENISIKKFNINTATKDEMKIHPYIKWNLANAIVEYRNQHGNFSTLDDLKQISLITDDIFNKIKFYFTL
jgi:competence protein ComEA